jgi:hypothetical protein
MFEVNKKIVTEYLSSKGAFCPKCSNCNTETGSFHWSDDPLTVYLPETCLDCGFTWENVFELKGISTVASGDVTVN